jgi:hypothetical protein
MNDRPETSDITQNKSNRTTNKGISIILYNGYIGFVVTKLLA